MPSGEISWERAVKLNYVSGAAGWYPYPLHVLGISYLAATICIRVDHGRSRVIYARARPFGDELDLAVGITAECCRNHRIGVIIKRIYQHLCDCPSSSWIATLTKSPKPIIVNCFCRRTYSNGDRAKIAH